MGSKWILHLLNNVSQEWKDIFIKCWISIAPVYNGSPKILKALIDGDNAGIFLQQTFEFKSVMQTWESLYWLLPKTNGAIIKTKSGVYGWGPNV